ncbi:MAG: hypothetical protein Kow0074_07570 [Candidatus Zixiibacteriota bacterium]
MIPHVPIVASASKSQGEISPSTALRWWDDPVAVHSFIAGRRISHNLLANNEVYLNVTASR